MADIRIKSGKAWLGVSGFGVKLKVHYQPPNWSPVLVEETPSHNAGNGTLGNGEFAWDRQGDTHYVYLITYGGVGTYKLWAEHPDNPGVKSNEETYYFDPDNYQGPGDPFDWNGDGIVQNELIVPGKWFTIYGVHRRETTLPSDGTEDWDHIVVSTSSSCDTLIPNHRDNITVPYGEYSAWVNFSGKKFAFPGNPGNTFYAYIRDHNCNEHSSVYTISNVTGSGGNYDVGTHTVHV